jgi:hypothetical protein
MLTANMLKLKSFSNISGLLLWLFACGNFFSPPEIRANDIQKDTKGIHLVRSGESLNKIAKRYFSLTEAVNVGDLISQIREINGIEGSLIRPKQRLHIPLSRSTPVKAKTIPKEKDFESKGIYVNRYSMGSKKIRWLVDDVISPEGNTVILDGKDMLGRLSFPSEVDLAREIGACAYPVTPDPDKLIHYLHEKGLHVGARLVLFFDPLLAEKRPELALRSKFTGKPIKEYGKGGWVDPAHPVVRKYNLDIARELAAMGVDEIQFDYIRYPTARIMQEPIEFRRHEIITQFLAEARKVLASSKVLISIDVFGIMAWGRPEDVQMTGQKLEDLAEYSDVISPMIYPSHFSMPFQGISKPGNRPYFMVSEACRRFSNIMKDSKVTLRPWIQAFPYRVDRFNKDYILEQLRALDASETRGWLLWSAGNAYRVARKALVQWHDRPLKEKNLTAKLFQEDQTVLPHSSAHLGYP